MSGTIPDTFSNLVELQYLDFGLCCLFCPAIVIHCAAGFNKFSGSSSSAFSTWTKLKFFLATSNQKLVCLLFSITILSLVCQPVGLGSNFVQCEHHPSYYDAGNRNNHTHSKSDSGTVCPRIARALALSQQC